MALGFVSVVMIATARGYFGKLRRGLAAVGRMALSNYILQSILGIVIFHDMGFGLWSDLDRHQLYYVVFGQWAVMIAFSVWWLNRYRSGPWSGCGGHSPTGAGSRWRCLSARDGTSPSPYGDGPDGAGRDKPVPYGGGPDGAGRDGDGGGPDGAGRDEPVGNGGGPDGAGRA